MAYKRLIIKLKKIFLAIFNCDFLKKFNIFFSKCYLLMMLLLIHNIFYNIIYLRM